MKFDFPKFNHAQINIDTKKSRQKKISPKCYNGYDLFLAVC